MDKAGASKDIKDLGWEDLQGRIAPFGKERYRARQLARWLYRTPVDSFDEMTNLSKEVRGWLDQRYVISQPEIERIVSSEDGTRKLLLRLEDGKHIESVLIPKKGRLTLCVSTQVGCGMGCKFCRTAQMGLARNLSVGEITNQAIAARSVLKEDEGITGVVFMGMGEPLHNADNVVKAVRFLVDDDAFGMAPRRVTVSTVGHLPGIQRLKEADSRALLAVSLNATTDEVRDRIMPMNRKWPIAQLMATLKEFPLPRKGKITIEYVLLDGVNDSLDDAKRLCKLVAHIPVKVNLIQFNPYPGADFAPSPLDRIQAFQAVLADKGILSRVRFSGGRDVLAACGQLATEQEERSSA